MTLTGEVRRRYDCTPIAASTPPDTAMTNSSAIVSGWRGNHERRVGSSSCLYTGRHQRLGYGERAVEIERRRAVEPNVHKRTGLSRSGKRDAPVDAGRLARRPAERRGART